MTTGEQFVSEENETAHELAKDGAEAGAMVMAKALTIKPLRKDIYASVEYAVYLHIQVEASKDGYAMVPREKETCQFARQKKRRQETQNRTLQGLGQRRHVYEMWKEK